MKKLDLDNYIIYVEDIISVLRWPWSLSTKGAIFVRLVHYTSQELEMCAFWLAQRALNEIVEFGYIELRA